MRTKTVKAINSTTMPTTVKSTSPAIQRATSIILGTGKDEEKFTVVPQIVSPIVLNERYNKNSSSHTTEIVTSNKNRSTSKPPRSTKGNIISTTEKSTNK